MSLVAVDSMDYGLKKLEASCPGKWQNFPSEVLRIREKQLLRTSLKPCKADSCKKSALEKRLTQKVYPTCSKVTMETWNPYS